MTLASPVMSWAMRRPAFSSHGASDLTNTELALLIAVTAAVCLAFALFVWFVAPRRRR